MPSLNARLAQWTHALTFSEIPADVAHATKLRIADTIGLMFAGRATPFGFAVQRAVLESAASGPSRVAGAATSTQPEVAALVNGACAHVLEFDDTHIETAIHVSSSVVSAALAMAEAQGASGSDLLAAVAAANEVTCRLGVVAPGDFHKNAFHPTGVFGAFGSAHAAARLFGLGTKGIADAVGIVGSQAAGLMAAWTDGTEAKSMHPGWSAHCGIMSARLARAGVSGPDLVFEGPLGLFRSHVQNPAKPLDFDRAQAKLGNVWESRTIAFKPYPSGHLIHAFIDAALAIVAKNPLRPEDIAEIICPIADHMVPLVCEPVEKKLNPATTWHCRVSLHWSLGEALVLGRLDRHAYDLDHPRADDIRRLARKVRHEVDPRLQDRRTWSGHVIIKTADGRTFEHIEPQNRGSPANPLSDDDLKRKFVDNVSDAYSRDAASRLFDTIMNIEKLPSVVGLLR